MVTLTSTSVAPILIHIYMQGNITHVERQDKCFHKRNVLPALEHMLYRSMTHAISMDLETGTVCTFIACIKSRFEEYMDTVNDTCTIGAPTALPVLPAICKRTGSEQCQCSCSPGFEGIADSSIDGNTCEAIVVPHPASTVTSTFIIAPTSYIHVVATPTRSKHLVTTTPVTTPSITTTSSISAQTSPSITIPLTLLTGSPIATGAVSHDSGLGHSNTPTVISVVSGVAAVLLIVVIGMVIFCLGTVKYKRMKLNKFHEQRTMPFKQQKREKIDPNFIPDNWKMDTRIAMSKSIDSKLDTFPPHPHSSTEEEGAALMMAITETVPGEDGQISNAEKRGAYVYRVSEGSSGYVTEGSLGFISESLICQVKNYTDSISQDNNEVRLQGEGHVQNERGYIVDRKSSQQTNCSEDYMDSISQDNDGVRLQGKIDVKNDGYVVDRNSSQQTNCSPENYLAPILCTDVSFTFPLDMNS
ncbi:uncharacterized protein LOC135331138 isoform X2 [Halichondria panicea]|uniref:uncharacterized protein LOC135331138 isoform X2 n=1 Tax=Halichondria panicea TaxID=6063 RepID=UPI00312B96E8